MSVRDLRKNQPYHFVPVQFSKERPAQTHKAGFHDGSEPDRYTGVMHCTLTTKTPMLVGHFQYPAAETVGVEIDVPQNTLHLAEAYWGEISRENKLSAKPAKSIIEPLFLHADRTQVEGNPVLIPGTSIKGMLRQVIGAMTHAPMERVADNEERDKEGNKGRAFSIRPQLGSEGSKRSRDYWEDNNHRLQFHQVTVNSVPEKDNSLQVTWNESITDINDDTAPDEIEAEVVNNFLRTNDEAYSEDKNSQTEEKRKKHREIESGDNIYVEYDREENRIVSFGHIDLYRWASADSTQYMWNTGDERQEKAVDDLAHCPRRETHSPESEKVENDRGQLTGARLFFGYVDGGKGEGGESLNLGIGKEDHARLAGRIAINHAVEVNATDQLEDRFVQRQVSGRKLGHYNLQLRILSSPKPSAFWCYTGIGSNGEYSDEIQSWGDLPGISESGHPLAGRKFYIRWNANEQSIQVDDEATCQGNQNQIARYVSSEGGEFRFSLRFKDLNLAELGVLLLALEPFRFKEVESAELPASTEELWHAIGHGRPLGMGGVTLHIDTLNIFDCATLEMGKKSDEWMQSAVKTGAQTLCHAPSLRYLWSIMRPQDNAPDLKNFYGKHDAHNEVKTDYLARRRD